MSLKDRLLDKNQAITFEQEKEIITAIKDNVKNDKNFLNLFSMNRNEYRDKLLVIINDEIHKRFPLREFEVSQDFLEYVLSEIFGLGILEKYLSDKRVTDIFIQDREMIVISNGEKKYLGKVFNSLDEVSLIVDRIKASSGKTVDQRMPFLNTELYDGSRCSIVIPPISDRIYITLRVFNCLNFELQDLLNLGMFNSKMFGVLNDLVRDKKNILIAGSMGSGKTTLLNTLAKLIPKNEVINIIQDLPEIKLDTHPYVRKLTTRPKSRETDNEINQDRLVYETLRMKADRIIVGEVRDCMAAYQMLQALNTGHRGSFSTIHADSAYDGLLRLEMLAMEYKANLSNNIIKKIVSRAIDTVLFLECEKDEHLNIINRKISEIVSIDKSLNKAGDYKLSYL